MPELLTSAQMRAVERAAIESGAVTGLELMERAGRGVVAAILAEWPELERGPSVAGDSPGALPRTPGYLGTDEGALRAAVLCGPGNNGGDGFVVARLLRERGWEVHLFFHGEPDRLPPDARVNYERWQQAGGKILGYSELIEATCVGFDGYALIVDALFGIGLSRPLDACWRAAFDRLHWHQDGTKAIAIDIPSGFNSDTGQVVEHPPEYLAQTSSCEDPQQIAFFDMTVTFHRMKVAHGVPECARHCGKIIVVDLGLSDG
nr:NAD(P)H-hydrate epimerase [Gemmobacter serpentinus]